MIFIFFSFLVILIITMFLLQDAKPSILEPIGVSALLLLGISGLVPFICREFLNISYVYSSFEILTVVSVVASFVAILSGSRRNKLNWHYKIERTDLLIILFASLILIRGYLLPMRGWDAYSLYDSRALMFLSGTKLSQMVAFSKYDEFNQLYYFSYPPMTSVLHTVMYANSNTHVMLIYAIFYAVFMIFVYLFLRTMKLNKVIKFLLFVISALNPLIFQHTKLAYTNLPNLSFQFVSLYYLVKFANSRKNSHLVISALLLAFSNWTRSLEPFFISFFVAFVLIVLIQKNTIINKIFQGVKYLFLSMTTWIIWHFYIMSTIGNLGATSPSILEILSKVYDSFLLSNLLDVAFFIYNAYFPIILYVLMAIFIFMIFLFRKKKTVKIEEKIIMTVILTIEALVFGGTLYFSTTFPWWNQIPDSLLRSNLILIPLIGVLSGYVLESVQIKIQNVKKPVCKVTGTP